ncbi:MAG: hypothetical protein KDA60_20055 [Planctomycetales bacterium]|nr:hypothetical protein [Planctomycetales bacterium]
MSAGEKVSWLELVVSVSAMIVVTALYPWLGDGATGAFGLLGLLGFTTVLLRRRGDRIVVDERDREIGERGTKFGVLTAWMMLFLTLIGVVLWSASRHQASVSVTWLTWLLWVQFALCYAVKGMVGVLSYRGDRHAA